MKKPILILTSIALVGLLIWAFQAPKKQEENGKLQVAASFYPMYFFASQIAGDKADISVVTPSGTEPHDYELSAQDLVRLEKSDLIILNGGIEPWARTVQNTLKTKAEIIVTAQTSVGGDPHFWLNPFLAKEQAQKITDGFTKLDPASKEYYEANQKNLNERLDEIDKRYKESLANCRQDLVVTSHAAFGYLANRYAFDQVSIAGISPEEEPSPQNLIQVSKFVKDNNIEYIFFETLVSPRLSETIAKETGAKTLVLDPIEGLSQEDMAKGKDYFTLMEQNLENLVIALECTR